MIDINLKDHERGFPLGKIVITPGASAAFEATGEHPRHFLVRHSAGDWGELSSEDKTTNDHAFRDGDRLLSAYSLKDGTKIWIITEWDRSVTTILLPDEY